MKNVSMIVEEGRNDIYYLVEYLQLLIRYLPYDIFITNFRII